MAQKGGKHDDDHFSKFREIWSKAKLKASCFYVFVDFPIFIYYFVNKYENAACLVTTHIEFDTGLVPSEPS